MEKGIFWKKESLCFVIIVFVCLPALFVTERIINMFINIFRRLPGEQ